MNTRSAEGLIAGKQNSLDRSVGRSYAINIKAALFLDNPVSDLGNSVCLGFYVSWNTCKSEKRSIRFVHRPHAFPPSPAFCEGPLFVYAVMICSDENDFNN